MADEDLEAGVKNVSLEDDGSQPGEGGADGGAKEKKSFKLDLPCGMTPITLGIAVLAIASTLLSVGAFMKTQTYKVGLVSAMESARDPANLSYYRDANLTFLAGQTYKPHSAVVILGSDLGHCWTMIDVLREDAVVNRSIAKQSYAQMMLRFEQDVFSLAPRAVVLVPPLDAVLKPNWLLVQTKMLGEVALEMGIQPVITTVAPIPESADEIEGGYIGRIRSANRSLRDLAQKKGWPCLDFYEILVGEDHFLNPEYAREGLWPNAHGYGEMTRAVEAFLDAWSAGGLAHEQAEEDVLQTASR